MDPRQVLLVGPGLVHAPSARSGVRVPSWTSIPPRASSTATAVPQLPAPITAALRSGGRPPSHSHCSSITGQMRAPTELASAGDGSLGAREGESASEADLDLLRADLPAPPDLLGSMDGHRQDGRPRLEREAPESALRASERARPVPGSLREDADSAAPLQHPPRGDQGLLVRLASADGIGAEPVEDPALPAPLEELDLRHVVEGPPERERGADHERVEEAAVVGGDDQRPLDLPVLAADPRQPEVDEEERESGSGERGSRAGD